MDWIQQARDYAIFLDYSEQDSFEGTDQERARQWCQETLEHIIAINGTAELFETERELAKKLNYDLE